MDDAFAQLGMCADAGPLLLLHFLPFLVAPKHAHLLPTEAYGEPLPPAALPAALPTSGPAASVPTASAGGGAGSANASPARAAAPGADAAGETSATVAAAAEGGTSPSDANATAAASAAAAAANAPLPAAAPAAQPPSAEAIASAVAAALPYLTSHRSRLLSALAEEEQSALAPSAATADGAVAADGAGGSNQSPAFGALARDRAAAAPTAVGSAVGAVDDEAEGNADGAAGGPRQLLAVIDSAMLSALLLLPDSGALLRLLQRPHRADLGHGAAALASAGRYAELAALYHSRGRHAEGLQLLRTLSQRPEALSPPPVGAALDLRGLPGVWAAVRCAAVARLLFRVRSTCSRVVFHVP